MSFAHQGAEQDFHIWSKGPWLDKSHLWNVSVRLLSCNCFAFAVIFGLADASLCRSASR